MEESSSQWGQTDNECIWVIRFNIIFQAVDFIMHTSYINWWQNSISFDTELFHVHTSTPESGRPYTYKGAIGVGC